MSIQKPKVSVIIPVYNNAQYLRETLESLEKQTLKEFEVIVVNDGSKDESEKIIDRFTETDSRFLKVSQENQGVSAARNAGLAIARGVYVTFVDGDDTLPENSLMEMQKTAEREEADLIIGGIQRIDGFAKKINQRTKKLKDKKIIKKDDLDLVHGLSLCNKWFFKEIIDDHILRLEPFRHLEDGVFLYNFLQYAEKISYCDVIIYNYWKRIPIITGSVTQRVERGLLESAVEAYERLKELTKDYSKEFQQELAYRINSTTFIGDYYKKIWYLDEKTEELLISTICETWEEMSEDQKRRTISSHPGLMLEKGFQTKEMLLAESMFNIVLTPEVSKEQLNLILKSLYGQAVPSFRVMVDESFSDCIDESFRKMKNLFLIKASEVHMEEKKAGYCIVLREDAVFDYDTLAVTCQLFQKEKCDAVRIRIVHAGRELKIVKAAVNAKRTGEKLKTVSQNKAPFLMIKDLSQVEELTKPTLSERMGNSFRRLVKGCLRRLGSLLR